MIGSNTVMFASLLSPSLVIKGDIKTGGTLENWGAATSIHKDLYNFITGLKLLISKDSLAFDFQKWDLYPRQPVYSTLTLHDNPVCFPMPFFTSLLGFYNYGLQPSYYRSCYDRGTLGYVSVNEKELFTWFAYCNVTRYSIISIFCCIFYSFN